MWAQAMRVALPLAPAGAIFDCFFLSWIVNRARDYEFCVVM